MHSHFFYPTASGSLGEARRLAWEKTIVKRESENPAAYPGCQPLDRAVRSQPAILIAEDKDDGLLSGSRGVPTQQQ
jgi:hypothetical protein